MSKEKDKNQDVQFVYEEDDSKTLVENPSEVLSDEELSGLEFAAATIITENPLLGTQQEAEELNQEFLDTVDDGNALELSEEAKKQKTATVLHIDRNQLKKAEKSGEHSNPQIKSATEKSLEHRLPVSDPTRDSIKPQSLSRPVEAAVHHQKTQETVRPPSIAVKAEKSTVKLVEDESVIERIHQIETHAEVRIALAEFKAEFLAEHLGEAKALEYQIKQLLKPMAKTNNEALVKQIRKIFSLLEEHSKGTIDLVKNKAQAEKIVKPTQDKANKILSNQPIKKAS